MRYVRVEVTFLPDNGAIPYGNPMGNRGWVIDAYPKEYTSYTFNGIPRIQTAYAVDRQDYINRAMEFHDEWASEGKLGRSAVYGNRETGKITWFLDRDWWIKTFGTDPLTQGIVINHFFNEGVTNLLPVPLEVSLDPNEYDCIPVNY
jgi:hypothetical protein